jgi:hypothetical protein
MKQVEIYDQFNNVYDTDGVTLLHASNGSTSVEGSFETQEEANQLVETLYNDSKELGSYTDKIVKLNEGYAELVIVFADKRRLNRVIYTKTV